MIKEIDELHEDFQLVYNNIGNSEVGEESTHIRDLKLLKLKELKLHKILMYFISEGYIFQPSPNRYLQM